MNAVVKEMAVLGKPEERCVFIEDTIEIRSDAPNTLQLRTSERVDMDGLLLDTFEPTVAGGSGMGCARG